MYIPADKTRNLYKMDADQHSKLLRENITKTYKSTDASTVVSINAEAQRIAKNIGIAERMDPMA